ncbi:hypothetical protein BJX76DRAFT_342595 [Aspergillus varians]
MVTSQDPQSHRALKNDGWLCWRRSRLRYVVPLELRFVSGLSGNLENRRADSLVAKSAAMYDRMGNQRDRSWYTSPAANITVSPGDYPMAYLNGMVASWIVDRVFGPFRMRPRFKRLEVIVSFVVLDLGS